MSCHKYDNEIFCICSGTISQDDARFGTRQNHQCVAISVYVGSVFQNMPRLQFSPQFLNKLIVNGDRYYATSKLLLGPNHRYDHLNIDEVDSNLTYENTDFAVRTELVSFGLFPQSIDDVNRCLLELENSIVEATMADCAASYVFIGLEAAVSFWRHDDEYMLFNSHKVSEFGVYNRKGVCRLFKCLSVGALAKLLLRNIPSDYGQFQYEISKVKATPVKPALQSSSGVLTTKPTSFIDQNIIINNYEDQIECISAGTISQDDARFGKRRNNQCVAISTYVGSVVQSMPNVKFSPQLLDQLIINGDRYYADSKSLLGPKHKEDHLNIDEVNPVLNYHNTKIVIRTELVAFGLYPLSNDDFNRCLLEIKNSLEKATMEDGPSSSYVFIGLDTAVSFWKHDNGYVLFNSHKVNDLGLYSNSGVCRLFKCLNVGALAKLLLRKLPMNYVKEQYEISRVVATPSNSASQTSKVFSKTGTNKFLDPKLQMKCVVVLERNINFNSENITLTNMDELSPGDRTERKRQGDLTAEDTVEACVVAGRKRPGRPLKKSRGRPKTSSLTRDEQHRAAVKRFDKSHPDVHRKAVKQYTDDNPDVNRKAVKRYTDDNPDVNRKAVKRYTDDNPDVNRKAVKKYNEHNPDVHRKGVEKYNKNNPDIHRKAVKRYNDNNPDVNRKAVKIYADSNPGRHMPAQLRKGGLIAEYTGEELKTLSPYRFKNLNLRSESCTKCSHCGARLFEEERGRTQWCCGQGKYNVLNLPPLNQPFYNDKRFLARPRMYNDAFAFCSLVIHQKSCPKGLSFVKILGRSYHKVYDLSFEGPYPNMSSMYIDDGEDRQRHAQQYGLDADIIMTIQNYLTSTNPYIHLFKTLNNEPSENAHLLFEETTRRTHGPVLGDSPQSTEVAAIISCDTEPYNPRKICIWKIGKAQSHTIHSFHPLVEPFQYTLLYPEGTPGWHIGRPNNMGGKMSQLKYTRCLLLSEDRFTKFGKLSETWLVDLYARIDEERLRYYQRAQRKGCQKDGGLRTAPYDEIQSVLRNEDHPDSRTDIAQNVNKIVQDETVQGDGAVVPGRIFLPSSYTGGPRYMRVCYMNAMALVSRLGGPTYFLTFTAHGGWEEIKQSKHPNSKSEAHLCCRVFHIKLQELLRDIRCGRYFGNISYIVWVIEFQMRGLPHAHICFRVEDGGPIQSHEIDKVIRADIPSENEANGRLRPLVLRHMMHGPCGTGFRVDLPCWDKGLKKCSKFFPKPHNVTTYIDEKGFANYKRNSNNKVTIRFRGAPFETDDRWVVPYNAALLLKYECHLNLEIASARRVVKYLFKYISKGSPLQRVALVPEDKIEDEVEEYVTKRYIGASDAAWRILQFDNTGREPPVKVLPVHLEGKHNVIFSPGNEAEAIKTSSSLLTLYFGRPSSPEMDSLTYLDFYEQYNVSSKRPTTKNVPILEHPDGVHFITVRQRGECVARMFWVAPNRGEQYYLRILLAKFSCHSYGDLYLLGGDGCSSFQQAARTMGLADDNREYVQALREASGFMKANILRQFFVLLCNIGASAADLWDAFKCELSEDFLMHFQQDNENAFKFSLVEIDRCLRRHGSSLSEVGLPVVEDDSTELIREHIKYNTLEEVFFFEKWEKRLSADQNELLNYVKILIQDSNTLKIRAIYLDGPGGYGKTLILQVIAAYLRSLNKIVLCVATSGIAALNFSGGATAHSTFRLPLDMSDGTGNWFITNGTERAELIREATLIIFDEAPMAHRNLIEMLDRSLKDLMGNDQRFGGKIVIFAGDFRQIPPVVEKAKTQSDVVNVSIRCSQIWGYLKKFHLTNPQRTDGEEVYTTFLLNLGENLIPTCVIGEGRNKEAVIPLNDISYVTSVKDLIEFVYPSDILPNPDKCAKRAVLCTHNKNVRELNEAIANRLQDDFQELLSYDSVAQDDGSEVQVEETMLHHAQGKGVPDHVLRLKVGAICMVMRNLNFDMALVNGTKVIVTTISRRLITVRKPDTEELFGIPRITFKFPVYNTSPISMYRRQFPLQLCYAISVHKSQGQTIDVVGVDLRSDCFTHGQLYVALSRVRTPKNIRVLVPTERIIDGTAYTKNVVFQKLL